MASIPHFEDNHQSIFSEKTRRKLSVALLGLTGVVCIALLYMLGKTM